MVGDLRQKTRANKTDVQRVQVYERKSDSQMEFVLDVALMKGVVWSGCGGSKHHSTSGIACGGGACL